METGLFSNIRQELLKELDQAESHIKIAVAWFTNHHLFQKLCEKIKADVKVELIIIDDFINNGDWGLDFQTFIDIGGNLFYGNPEKPVHHKFCIIDNSTLFNGSYNWTYYAENRNVENVVKFQDNHIVLQHFMDEFDSLRSTLSRCTTAPKRNINEMEKFNYYSIRNYVANDLYYRGKEVNETKYIEAAARVIPSNDFLRNEYNKVSQQKLIKKTISSLGISVRKNGKDNHYLNLIPKGSSVPIEISQTLITIEDNQTSMQIHTLKGENDNIQFNSSLGSFVIDNLPPRPSGKAEVVVTFNLNKDGVLTVTAKSQDTDNQVKERYYLADILF